MILRQRAYGESDGTMDDYVRNVFAGQEVAARWWTEVFKSGMGIKNLENEQPLVIRSACDELVGYMMDTLPGIERWLHPRDALRMGFLMGASFQRALDIGELGGGLDSLAVIADVIRPPEEASPPAAIQPED